MLGLRKRSKNNIYIYYIYTLHDHIFVYIIYINKYTHLHIDTICTYTLESYRDVCHSQKRQQVSATSEVLGLSPGASPSEA